MKSLRAAGCSESALSVRSRYGRSSVNGRRTAKGVAGSRDGAAGSKSRQVVLLDIGLVHIQKLRYSMCTFFGAHRKFPDMVSKCAHFLQVSAQCTATYPRVSRVAASNQGQASNDRCAQGELEKRLPACVPPVLSYHAKKYIYCVSMYIISVSINTVRILESAPSSGRPNWPSKQVARCAQWGCTRP